MFGIEQLLKHQWCTLNGLICRHKHVKDPLVQHLGELLGFLDLRASKQVKSKRYFPQHRNGKTKYGERGSVSFARGFIVVVTLIAYVIALVTPASIFELAVRFAFSGFAAMAPVMVAALFWKRSTKYGAL